MSDGLKGILDDDMKTLETICKNPEKFIKHIEVDNVIKTISFENAIFKNFIAST